MQFSVVVVVVVDAAIAAVTLLRSQDVYQCNGLYRFNLEKRIAKNNLENEDREKERCTLLYACIN